MKGSYVLLLHLAKAQPIVVGRLGEVSFSRGYYAYVGSAMHGFKARVSRYLKPAEKPHWHIDFLRNRSSMTGLVLCPSGRRTECAIAHGLAQQLECIPGFGASDCHCRSHLFLAGSEDSLKRAITEIGERLELEVEFLQPSAAGVRFGRP